MDELKLEWKRFHAFPFVRDSQCREARTGVLVLHAFPDGDWAAGMHLAWDLRLRGKTAPDLVEAMRAAEAALFAELRPYGAESQLMENWRATREARLLNWLRDREAVRTFDQGSVQISIGGQKLTIPATEQDTAADLGARLRREFPPVAVEAPCPRRWAAFDADPRAGVRLWHSMILEVLKRPEFDGLFLAIPGRTGTRNSVMIRHLSSGELNEFGFDPARDPARGRGNLIAGLREVLAAQPPRTRAELAAEARRMREAADQRIAAAARNPDGEE